MRKHFVLNLLILLLSSSFPCFAQVSSGYYDAANGKAGEVLKTSLFEITKNYISADYDGFTATYWGNTYYVKTDWNPSGYFWDMYSNEQRVTYNSSLMSREHCMPRSWWVESSDYGTANSDLHNLYPADYTANSNKSNLPLGQVGVVSWTNGVVKIGANTYSGYSGQVFEPADEYKGDFARTYFYMVTSHQDYASRWKSTGIASMLDSNTYPVFKRWAIDMLLDWARQDPVSQKEIDRNNAVFTIQQNRNPFIDYPDLYEYIWGSKTAESFQSTSVASSVTLITPINNTSVNFGSIAIKTTKLRTIPIKTVLQTESLILQWDENTSGYFSIGKSRMEPSTVNQASGDTLNIVYAPLVAGTHTAKLHITNASSGISSVVELTGMATNFVLPVTPDEDAQTIFFYKGPWTPEALPSNFYTNVSSPYVYSNSDLRMSSNKDYLTVSFDSIPDYMRFAIYPRNAWGSNENHIYVYEGESLSTIGTTPIADFDNSFVTVGDSYNNTPAIFLRESTRAIKIEYQKVSQNAGINNLFVTLKQSSSINNSTNSFVKLSAANGNIVVRGVSERTLYEIWNLWSQLIQKGYISDSESILEIHSRGIFVVRVGQVLAKVVLM